MQITKEEMASMVWYDVTKNARSNDSVQHGTFHVSKNGSVNFKKVIAVFVKDKSLLSLKLCSTGKRTFIVFQKSKECENMRFDHAGRSIVTYLPKLVEIFGKNVNLEYDGDWINESLFLEIVSSKPFELTTHRGRKSK